MIASRAYFQQFAPAPSERFARPCSTLSPTFSLPRRISFALHPPIILALNASERAPRTTCVSAARWAVLLLLLLVPHKQRRTEGKNKHLNPIIKLKKILIQNLSHRSTTTTPKYLTDLRMSLQKRSSKSRDITQKTPEKPAINKCA